jgi:hypothetical protein
MSPARWAVVGEYTLRPPQRGAMANDSHLVDTDAAESPPLGSWRRMYAVVIGELILLIVLFTLFAQAFR